MAGENVPERVVRKVFSSSIDLVVHLDRSVDQSDNSIIRQAMEVRALVPALHEDFSSEPIFTRPRLGAPIEWTGALPPADLVDRIECTLEEGQSLRSLLERVGRSW